ncbi:MAG: hypothetical protein JKY01_03035 [Pseudomonadales bacterium]|nr:hypothetical protein [Pseudomonadales bacterium]
MSKVIRSHPVVGSRKLQAPYQDDDGKARSSARKPAGSLNHGKKSTSNVIDDRIERQPDKGQELAEISPALFNEIKKSLDAESEKRVIAEQKFAALKEQLDALNRDLDDEKRKGYEKGLAEGNKAAEDNIAHKYKEVSEVSDFSMKI